MRITLIMDDDVLATARHLAERQQQSLGVVISMLARQGLLHGVDIVKKVRNGVPLLPPRKNGPSVTLELANHLGDAAL